MIDLSGVKKEKFICSKSTFCKAALYMVYLGLNAMVTLLRNEFDHDHILKQTRAPLGIDEATKEKIEELYRSGVTRPMNINYALRT